MKQVRISMWGDQKGRAATLPPPRGGTWGNIRAGFLVEEWFEGRAYGCVKRKRVSTFTECLLEARNISPNPHSPI